MITISDVTAALAGGTLIGAGSVLLMALDGRIAGISGIYAGAVIPVRGDWSWRAAFVAGLCLGAVALILAGHGAAPVGRPLNAGLMVAAGLLVGVGTRLGRGCTSGHGVCGLALLSARSLAAVATFLATGMASVFIIRHLLGASS